MQWSYHFRSTITATTSKWPPFGSNRVATTTLNPWKALNLPWIWRCLEKPWKTTLNGLVPWIFFPQNEREISIDISAFPTYICKKCVFGGHYLPFYFHAGLFLIIYNHLMSLSLWYIKMSWVQVQGFVWCGGINKKGFVQTRETWCKTLSITQMRQVTCHVCYTKHGICINQWQNTIQIF